MCIKQLFFCELSISRRNARSQLTKRYGVMVRYKENVRNQLNEKPKKLFYCKKKIDGNQAKPGGKPPIVTKKKPKIFLKIPENEYN